MARRAFITGITGQDGSYLAELLLAKGYEVHGLVRRCSTHNLQRIEHLCQPEDPKIRLHMGDITDAAALHEIIMRVQPDEVYNLAAQSDVRVSFEQPALTAQVGAIGCLHILESIRQTGRPIRFYQASTSEMFGKVAESPQNEMTRFHPRSPYGCAKLYAYWQTVNYRESYGVFCCNGILFNHESPRRGDAFVTRKITRAVTRIKEGLQEVLYLGNLDARRDWGFAGDYVDAMWRMLQHDRPDDYVIATGETHSVQEFVERAFACVGLDWKCYVRQDPAFMRPAEVDLLQGDPGKARRVLGWKPAMTFNELVRIMVESDWELARRERATHKTRNGDGVVQIRPAGRPGVA